jgi:hypothetical protein
LREQRAFQDKDATLELVSAEPRSWMAFAILLLCLNLLRSSFGQWALLAKCGAIVHSSPNGMFGCLGYDYK